MSSTKIYYNAKDLYFELGNFTLEGEEVGMYFLSSNTVMLAHALIRHYGKWRNRYTYDLSKADKPKLSNEDFDKVSEIVDLAIEELMTDATEYLAKMSKSLEEIEFTMKNNRANTTTDKVVRWFISKPPTPTTASPNPSFTSDVQGVHEYKTTTGALMGLGEILGTAYLDDLDVNPLPNPFGQSSKLDTLNESISEIMDKVETIKDEATEMRRWSQDEWFDLMKYFSSSFREGVYSNLNPFSQKTFFKMLQDSLNDTSAIFGADKPYFRVFLEKLEEFKGDLYDLASNSTEIHWTFKHLVARISKSGQIVQEMPRPLQGEAGISTNDSVFNTRMSDNNNITLGESLITAFLFANGKSSYFEKIKDELDTIATTLSSPIRNLLEYIGNGLNISPFGSTNPVGMAYLFVNALFRMGDWRYPENSFLSDIAKKDLSVTVTPNVTAKVDLNESGITINNQVNPTPVTINNQVQTPTIQNILEQSITVDACCDNGTPKPDPTTGQYPPIDPTNPNSPTIQPNQPTAPIVIPKLDETNLPIGEIEIKRANMKNAFCGYIFYSVTAMEGWVIWLADNLLTMQALLTAFGLSWIADYIYGLFEKSTSVGGGKPVISGGVDLTKGVNLVKAGKAVIIKYGQWWKLLDMTRDSFLEMSAIFKNEMACNITGNGYEDTVLDGKFFYDATANILIQSGYLPSIANIYGEMIKDFVDYGLYDPYFDLTNGVINWESYAKYCPCPTQAAIPVCDTSQPLQFGLGHSIVSAPFATNDTDNQVIPDEWSTPFLWAGSGYHQFTFEFDTLYNYGIPATTANVIGVFDLYIKVQRCADLQGTDAFDYINADFGLDSATQVYTIPDNVNIYGQPERLGWWTWEVSDNKLKVCIVVKTYDDWSSLSGYVAGSPFKGGYQYIRLAARPRVYINDPTTPSGNSPFNVTPSGNNYTANWANVTIPSGATVTLTANNVTIPYTGNSVTGQFDPNQGVTLVLSVSQNNANGSVTTTTYTQVINPMVAPKSFTVSLEYITNWAYYLDLTNSGITEGDSYTLTANGIQVIADTYGSLPLELKDYVGVVTFDMVVTKADNSQYTLTATVDKPVYDPCNGQPVNLDNLQIVRQPYSSFATVSFNPIGDVDTMEVYDNGQQAFINSNTGQIYLDRGINHTIKAVVHKYGSLECKADLSANYNMPNLVFVQEHNDYGDSVRGGWGTRIEEMTNDIAKGVFVGNIPALIPNTNGALFVFVPLDQGGNFIKRYWVDQYGDWHKQLQMELITQINDTNQSYLFGEVDGVFALATLTTQDLLTINNPNGLIWLRLLENGGTPVPTGQATEIIADELGLYREVGNTAITYWNNSGTVVLVNHPSVYQYRSNQTTNYFSFQFNTNKSVVSVLCGVFSLENWSLLTTFYLQGLNSLRVGNVVVVGGYKFNGITLPNNALVTVIEVGLV